MFTTVLDVQKLANATFWIMDGTFKTVPSSKTLYECAFEELAAFGGESGVLLNPAIQQTDFELGAINACRRVFPNATNAACYFHFVKCVWREVQESGLAKRYCRDENFNLKIRQLTALAFLPAEEIPDAFDLLKCRLPDQARQITEWFDGSNIIMGLHSFLMTRTALLYGQASVADSIAQFRIAKR
ncbi:hypothetical protein M513_13859 [Trichuris suis]|uniref:Uncharacterized protein n=1 Tax=Trichuris suis TaxID=68888 RepID=A0A085LJW7_9BILA|nr:hypothetical protein M513_13859 [Trichuris suis]